MLGDPKKEREPPLREAAVTEQQETKGIPLHINPSNTTDSLWDTNLANPSHVAVAFIWTIGYP